MLTLEEQLASLTAQKLLKIKGCSNSPKISPTATTMFGQFVPHNRCPGRQGHTHRCHTTPSTHQRRNVQTTKRRHHLVRQGTQQTHLERNRQPPWHYKDTQRHTLLSVMGKPIYLLLRENFIFLRSFLCLCFDIFCKKKHLIKINPM
ncbi:hypothetical protein MBAV_002653 [Candidatus Magnetobacterium bavaricum]|uniref:Uncharacterized protein n=1 Tax=Candidatus Magnetobacterium bavaricum TaxID=29290 RepID=A0A0F3GT53_9BACT|nr:hypothetical protein MBAV_002653 [Candidatus Magnetobacterium bavaricum]